MNRAIRKVKDEYYAIHGGGPVCVTCGNIRIFELFMKISFCSNGDIDIFVAFRPKGRGFRIRL